jgi:hypothetical protein
MKLVSLTNIAAVHSNSYILRKVRKQQPVTVAEPSKACTVFARSEPGIVSSNPTQGMDI